MMIMGFPSGVLRYVWDCGVTRWKFLALLEVKGFMVHRRVYLNTNLEIILGFLNFFSPMGSKSVLNLFQHLAMVMRQRKVYSYG